MGTGQSPKTRPVVRGTWYPTLEGIAWLLVALVLLYQGWLRSINLVALLGCFLLSLWLLNYFWVWRYFRLKKLRLARSVDEPVFAQRPFLAKLELANPTRRTQYGLRVTDSGTHHQHGWFVPVIRRGETVRHSYRLTLPQRGRYPWPPLSITTGYPFGLVRRIARFNTGGEIVVLPRLGRLERGPLRRLLLQQPHPHRSTKRAEHRHPGAQSEFHGLREFRSGDSPRWIHWRTTARVGELMVREFEEPPLDNLLLILDPWLPKPAAELRTALQQQRRENREVINLLLAAGPAPTPQQRQAKEAALNRKEEPFRKPLEALELAVSLAATVCWEWYRQPGARVLLGIAGQPAEVHVTDTGLSHVFPLLERLALVEGTTAADTTGLLRALSTAPLPPGPALLITTRPSELEGVLSSQLRRPVVSLDVTQPLVHDLFVLDEATEGARAMRPRAAMMSS